MVHIDLLHVRNFCCSISLDDDMNPNKLSIEYLKVLICDTLVPVRFGGQIYDFWASYWFLVRI